MRNRTSDLQILHSDALTLSHRLYSLQNTRYMNLSHTLDKRKNICRSNCKLMLPVKKEAITLSLFNYYDLKLKTFA